jgi:hydroxymethylpyrimidine pyrophosphatase-like HAD family hydrolase
MERRDQLTRLYEEHDAEAIRSYRDFVALFPEVDSRIVRRRLQYAEDELRARKEDVRAAFPEDGDVLAEIAARATAGQALSALELHERYGRAVNVLVLDVDETLRSAGGTDNEIPSRTLHLLSEFHEEGVPIVVCTGQTLENVKGFMIQGLGNGLVNSGRTSIVYEAGTGVFTPGHGADTKQLLYDGLDRSIRAVFERLRSRVLSDAPDRIRTGCHLQGNEFNVTLKPNFENGSDRARGVIDDALAYETNLLGEVVAESVGAVEAAGGEATEGGDDDAGDAGDGDGRNDPADRPGEWARAFYADQDPEVRRGLERAGAAPGLAPGDVPGKVRSVLSRIDVAHYEADAAEISSLELNKAAGTEAALDVLGVEDPFALVMGDSKSDLRVMEWAAKNRRGIAAAPEHASESVLEHVRSTDDLVYDPGNADAVLRIVAALNRLDRLA